MVLFSGISLPLLISPNPPPCFGHLDCETVSRPRYARRDTFNNIINILVKWDQDS